MFIKFVNYIMFISVMVMSCDIVSYITCMFYFLREIIIAVEITKFMYLRYSDVTISVYGIMVINNNIISKIIIRIILDLKLC